MKTLSAIDYIPSICHNGYDCTLHFKLILCMVGILEGAIAIGNK